MNEELVRRALKIFKDRAERNYQVGDFHSGSAYSTAAILIEHALADNEECLKEYEYQVDNLSELWYTNYSSEREKKGSAYNEM